MNGKIDANAPGFESGSQSIDLDNGVDVSGCTLGDEVFDPQAALSLSVC